MNSTIQEQIIQELCSTYPEVDSRQLQIYLSELFKWNPQVGLVTKKATETTVSRLVRLSASLWAYTRRQAGWADSPGAIRMMDIGTGGGFPGLIWKLLYKDLEGCLVDRKDRKVQFLEQVILKTGCSGLEAIAADVEDLAQDPGHQGTYSLVTMLAVKPPPVLGHEIETLLKPDGYFSTVRSGRQKIIQDRLGESLSLQDALTTDEGIFVIYRKEK